MDVRRSVVLALTVVAVAASGCSVVACGPVVPDVKGKTVAQAQDALTQAGFKSGAVTYSADAVGAAGAVVAQDPAAGARASAGAIVNLTVAGSEPVKVPSLVGSTQDEAAAALAAVGLALGDVTTEFSATAPAGEVVTQTPSAAAEVARDSAVDVVISSGKAPVAVPDVKGKAYAEAEAALKAAGFAVGRGDSAGAAAAGPGGGAAAAGGAGGGAGAKVTLTVSLGAPAKVKVPLVKGLRLAAAKSKLEAAGLKWSHVLGPGDGMVDVGWVYKQSPGAGALVLKGSTVTIYTWKGP